MTLVISWIRKAGPNTEELVTVSDSRVRFGCAWDCCPKIFPLERGDCVMAFAGWTGYGYPIVLQAVAAANMHKKLSSRALDLCALRGHLVRVANDMLEAPHRT